MTTAKGLVPLQIELDPAIYRALERAIGRELVDTTKKAFVTRAILNHLPPDILQALEDGRM